MAEFADCSRLAVRRKKSSTQSPRLQNYISLSLTELTEKLVKTAREEKSSDLSSRTRDIVYVLKAHKLRHSLNAHVFLEGRGVEGLLCLLGLCVEQEGRNRGLVLATLANLCSLNNDCRTKVMSCGLASIVQVLASLGTPATLCTVARLIANLALDSSNIPRLQEVGVVRELSHTLFFQRASDVASKLSVLRALHLLSSSESCRQEIRTNEGVPAIIECLKSNEENVVKRSLQILYLLLLESEPSVVHSLVSHKGFAPIIKQCNHGEGEVSERAVEVMVRCAGMSEARAGLHNAGGVECLLSQLERHKPEEKMYSSLVTALCSSCRDVVGRQRMRDCGGLETLIHLLSSSDQSSFHSDILSALVCYYFDENSLRFMVKRLGLLRALTYHIQLMSCQEQQRQEVEEEREKEEEKEEKDDEEEEGNTAEEEEITTGNEESLPSSPTRSGFDNSSSSSSVDSTNSSLFMIQSSSPSPSPLPPPVSPIQLSSSSVSPSFSSPSSPSLSPTETQPPCKKPRLSTDLEFSTPTPINFLDSLLSSPSPYGTPSRQPELPSTHDCSRSQESHVIQLLSRISHLRDCLPLLASRDLLLATLDCLLSSPSSYLHNHIFKTLSRVFASPHCFQEVVICCIPSRLNNHLYLAPSISPFTSSDLMMDLPSPSLSSPSSPGPGLSYMCSHLLSCLSRVGGSPCGQGVLAHLLLTGEERERIASVLTIPILCRSQRVCRKLMMDYGGLNILLNLLSSPDNKEAAANSILSLASSTADHNRAILLQASPGHTLNHSPNHLDFGRRTVCRYRDYDQTPFDIMVQLDGYGGREMVEYPVHRDVLMTGSAVFEVMLGGHFLESHQKTIHLKEVNNHAFLSLLHHLYGCGWQCPTTLTQNTRSDDLCDLSDSLIAAVTSKLDNSVSVSHTLHCLEIASRFLMDSMKESCEKQASLYLSVSTAVPLFLFSQLHNSLKLSEECVRYPLSLPPSLDTRNCLLSLASCPESNTVIELLQTLISSRLHNIQ